LLNNDLISFVTGTSAIANPPLIILFKEKIHKMLSQNVLLVVGYLDKCDRKSASNNSIQRKNSPNAFYVETFCPISI